MRVDRKTLIVRKRKPWEVVYAVLRLRWHPDDVNLPHDAGTLEKEPLPLKRGQMVAVKSWEELGFVEVEVEVEGEFHVPCASSF